MNPELLLSFYCCRTSTLLKMVRAKIHSTRSEIPTQRSLAPRLPYNTYSTFDLCTCSREYAAKRVFVYVRVYLPLEVNVGCIAIKLIVQVSVTRQQYTGKSSSNHDRSTQLLPSAMKEHCIAGGEITHVTSGERISSQRGIFSRPCMDMMSQLR
jgi:hypothetical protein